MIYELPIPKSPEVFENLVSDLANSLYKTTSFNLYGRKGQNQKGIDILSMEYGIVIQCKLRTLNLKDRKTKLSFVNDIIKDIDSILENDFALKKIIIATTLENDTLIQDYLQTIFHILKEKSVSIEFWSWSKISSELFLFPILVNKYFPYRNVSLEIARIQVLNKAVYQKSDNNELLFNFQNIENINQLPIFDISFINNSENTILLNSFDCFCTNQATARAGTPPKPTGILEVTCKYFIDLQFNSGFGDYERICTEIENPIYIMPRSAFRIQIQNTRPLINFYKIHFVFNFNSTIIQTPHFYFNAFNANSGRVIRELK